MIGQHKLLKLKMEKSSSIMDSYSKLPKQVIHCLQLTGFNNEITLSMLDVDEAESFLREYGEMIKDSDPNLAKLAYGVFFNCPTRFQFLPGHRILLNRFVEIHSKISKPKTANRASSALVVYEANPQWDVNLIAAKIQRNITSWCSKQDGVLRELIEGIHYALNVTTRKCEIKCLSCQRLYKISKVKDSFLISNYTRHLLSSCPELRNQIHNHEEVDLNGIVMATLEASDSSEQSRMNSDTEIHAIEDVPPEHGNRDNEGQEEGEAEEQENAVVTIVI